MTSKLANGSVLGEKLADGSVTSEKLVDGGITSRKLAPGILDSLGVRNDSVDSIKLASDIRSIEKVSGGSMRIVTKQEVVDQQQSEATTYVGRSQTFTAGLDGELLEIELMAYVDPESDSAPVWVRIYEVGAAEFLDSISTGVIEFPNRGISMRRVSMSPQVHLVKGLVYRIELEPINPIGIMGSLGDKYLAGSTLRDDTPDEDMYFKTYMRVRRDLDSTITTVSGDLSVGGNAQFSNNLTVTGKLNVGQDGKQSVTVADEALCIIRGNVSADGTVKSGSGYSITQPKVGEYHIQFATKFKDEPSITITFLKSTTRPFYLLNGNDGGTGSSLSEGFFLHVLSDQSTTDRTDNFTAFSFIAIGSR